MTYEDIKELVAGRDCKHFPLIGETDDGETAYVSEGYEDGEHFFYVEFTQKGKRCNVCHRYYKDGTMEEWFEYDRDADGHISRER